MKHSIQYYIALVVFNLVCTIPIKAQDNLSLTFPEFLKQVGEKNLAFAAERYNVSITEASIRHASIFPDPELGIETSNNGISKQMGYSLGGSIGWTLEMGGKRKARIDLAKNQTELSKILLDDFFRNLRAEASTSYVEALQAKAILNVQRDSYDNMKQLAKSDSIRYRLGAISLVTSKQSKLEAATLLNDVYQSEADVQQAIIALSIYLGSNNYATDVVGQFDHFNRDFTLNDLITNALNSRSDLLAAKQNTKVSKSQIGLEKANRIMDLGLNAGFTHNTEAFNELAPSPAVNAAQLGLSIPLKFSNKRNTDLKVAEMLHQQSELYYLQVENIIRAEVTQAYQLYAATQKQLQQYHNGLLTDAKSILEGINYAYQRGENSILEVLNAQRTYNETRYNYFELLANNAKALIDLEQKAGIWDIDM